VRRPWPARPRRSGADMHASGFGADAGGRGNCRCDCGRSRLRVERRDLGVALGAQSLDDLRSGCTHTHTLATLTAARPWR
jgi:hypothetical protein